MKTLYQCELCGAMYTAKKKAQACEAQGVPTGIKVGNIIKKRDGYSWRTDGPDYWIMFNSGEDRGTKLMDFYWLVIEVIEKAGSSSGHHCNQVTCVTRGIVNGASVDGKGDWGIHCFSHYLDENFSNNYPVLVEDPPAKVREEADAFMSRGYVIDSKACLEITTVKQRSGA